MVCQEGNQKMSTKNHHIRTLIMLNPDLKFATQGLLTPFTAEENEGQGCKVTGQLRSGKAEVRTLH